MKKKTNYSELFVFQAYHRKITHSAIITHKTTEKMESFKYGGGGFFFVLKKYADEFGDDNVSRIS